MCIRDRPTLVVDGVGYAQTLDMSTKRAELLNEEMCIRDSRYSGNLEVDFFSSGYLDVSVPRVVPPRPMCSAEGCQDFSWRVRPFGDPRVEGCVPLTADYRSLPRPSSAPCAKASAVRPRYLPAPIARDAVSRHLNVWVSHTLGESPHRRSSCNLLYVCRLEDMYLISLYRRIDQINK